MIPPTITNIVPNIVIVVLSPERGVPFQLVAERKWGYKGITQIELSNDVDYKGYWESRGYSNERNFE